MISGYVWFIPVLAIYKWKLSSFWNNRKKLKFIYKHKRGTYFEACAL